MDTIDNGERHNCNYSPQSEALHFSSHLSIDWHSILPLSAGTTWDRIDQGAKSKVIFAIHYFLQEEAKRNLLWSFFVSSFSNLYSI